MALGLPVSCIGYIVSGDLGALTIYTDRHGRTVAYPKSPPKEPPTDIQVICRARFKAAQAEYMTMTDDQKFRYEELTKKASLCLTGQNLFIHVAMKHTFTMLDTLQQQTGVSVPAPTPV